MEDITYVTGAELAREYGISRAAITKARQVGRLDAEWVTGRWMYNLDEVRKYFSPDPGQVLNKRAVAKIRESGGTIPRWDEWIESLSLPPLEDLPPLDFDGLLGE